MVIKAIKSNAKYQALLEAMPDPVAVYNTQGEAIYLNHAFEEVYGWSRKELLGRRIDFVPPEENESTRRAWERTLAGEKVIFETKRFTKDGQCLFIQLRTSIITDEAGNHQASVVIHRDVTESRQAQAELAQAHQMLEKRVVQRTSELHMVNERLLDEIKKKELAEQSLNRKVAEQELLLDNIQTQIWYLTDVDTYGAVNRAHAQFLGFPQDTVEGRTIHDILPTTVADQFNIDNGQVFKHKTEFSTERWVPNAHQENRLLSIVATPKLDQQGQVEFVICSGEDITDIRASEQTLRDNKKRLDLAMEATSDALWDWDLTTNRTFFNACFYTMLGYKPYELEQSYETWASLVHPQDRDTTFDTIRQYVEKGSTKLAVEYRLKTKRGGWRWIMARGKVVQWDPAGKPQRMVGTHVDITFRKVNEESMRQTEADLRKENIRLRSTLRRSHRFGKIIGKSEVMQHVYDIILKSALSPANVIIYGESGTGKELVAHTIHELSDRNYKSFVTVNCGAIPNNLIESEFFGYQKGAFTGAMADKPGFLDMADGGTLFMDEVAELDLNMQAKLLRALEGGGYTPIGGSKVKKPNIRIIAATNKDLKALVQNGAIREDFYYRVHIIPIQLPPLRKRKEDLPLLIHYFLSLYSKGRNLPSIPEHVMQPMLAHSWPGNVRELQNTLHRYITLNKVEFGEMPQRMAPTLIFGSEDSTPTSFEPMALKKAKETFEKQYIRQLLNEHQWHRGRVATLLKINRKTLFKKIKHHQLSKSPL